MAARERQQRQTQAFALCASSWHRQSTAPMTACGTSWPSITTDGHLWLQIAPKPGVTSGTCSCPFAMLGHMLFRHFSEFDTKRRPGTEAEAEAEAKHRREAEAKKRPREEPIEKDDSDPKKKAAAR